MKKRQYTTIVVYEMLHVWYFGNGKIVVPLQRENKEREIKDRDTESQR